MISLSPNITEIVATLGKEEVLVGVSTYCNYSPTVCNRQKVGTALTPHLEKIIKLNPDLILTQTLNHSPIVKKASGLGIKLVSFKFENLSDIINSINQLGEILKTSNSVEIVKKITHRQKELSTFNKNGGFIAIIDLVEKMGRVTGFVVAGPNTFYNDILKLTGMKNFIVQNGYSQLSLEKVLQLKHANFFIFTPSDKKIKEKMQEELKRFQYTKYGIFNFMSNYAVIPGPRIELLMADIYRELSDK
jgi:iron complex transport system substrate-binding protein